MLYALDIWGLGRECARAGGGAVTGTVWVSQSGACVRKKGTENAPDGAAVGERVGSWWQEADQAADPAADLGETAVESPRTGRVHLAPSGQETPSTRRRRSAGRDAGPERVPVRGLDGTRGGGKISGVRKEHDVASNLFKIELMCDEGTRVY